MLALLHSQQTYLRAYPLWCAAAPCPHALGTQARIDAQAESFDRTYSVPEAMDAPLLESALPVRFTTTDCQHSTLQPCTAEAHHIPAAPASIHNDRAKQIRCTASLCRQACDNCCACLHLASMCSAAACVPGLLWWWCCCCRVTRPRPAGWASWRA